MISVRKITKIPEIYMIFARKMPEFYIIIAQKYFCRLFLREARALPAPSPTPMVSPVNWFHIPPSCAISWRRHWYAE